VTWVWVADNVVRAIHEAQLAEHGGITGIRDQGLLSSALARPQNLHAYGDQPDMASLTAAYTFGIARNRPFLDGNKRTAFVVMELFLNLNVWTLNAADADWISTMLALAAGKMSEAALASWIRDRIERE